MKFGFLLLSIIIFGIAYVFTGNNTSCNMNSTLENTEESKNVFDEPLQLCCSAPVTGFYRNGKCDTGPDDYGTHIVCAVVTDDFLNFSKNQGNDLITPFPQYRFPGLKHGDRWCLCISRWIEAKENGVAPKIDLNATHKKALQFIELSELKKYSYK